MPSDAWAVARARSSTTDSGSRTSLPSVFTSVKPPSLASSSTLLVLTSGWEMKSAERCAYAAGPLIFVQA